MRSPTAVLRRVPVLARRRRTVAMQQTLDHVQELLESLNHTVVQMAGIIERLNHDVRSGADESLPLLLGYADRLRLDTDTSVAAAEVISREIAGLRAALESFDVRHGRG